MRGAWDMSFACGSNDAIRHLSSSEHPPDVVLAELELAGIDGIDLLKTIQSSAPHSVRLLHSEHASKAAICRSVPWAHQFLTKPLDIALFESTIARLRVDPTAHESHAISVLAGSADTLPALPSTYQRVVDISSRPDFSLREIAEAIQDDVALTAETMKVVNSSFFGLKGDVTSIEQAVSMLGLDVMRGLVLANSLFDADSKAADWLDLAALADRSQAVAALARAIAKADGHSNRDQALAFLSGMVHGAGLLLLGCCNGVDLPAGTGIEYSIDPEVDIRLFGIDRYALGAYLLRIWAFEPSIVEAVAGLGVPSGVVGGTTAATLRIASELVAWGGFSVSAFVEGDPDTCAMVAAMRAELSKRSVATQGQRAS
jgi:HD-like signal output (HDOD) protein